MKKVRMEKSQKKSQKSQDTHVLTLKAMMGDEMDASIHRTGVAMRHTGIGRP